VPLQYFDVRLEWIYTFYDSLETLFFADDVINLLIVTNVETIYMFRNLVAKTLSASMYQKLTFRLGI